MHLSKVRWVPAGGGRGHLPDLGPNTICCDRSCIRGQRGRSFLGLSSLYGWMTGPSVRSMVSRPPRFYIPVAPASGPFKPYSQGAWKAASAWLVPRRGRALSTLPTKVCWLTARWARLSAAKMQQHHTQAATPARVCATRHGQGSGSADGYPTRAAGQAGPG
jgi:hypothetical protein